MRTDEDWLQLDDASIIEELETRINQNIIDRTETEVAPYDRAISDLAYVGMVVLLREMDKK